MHDPRGILRTRLRGRRLVLLVSLLGFCLAAYAQREFRVYESFEGDDGADDLPADYQVPGEFVVGRLMYPSTRFGFFGGGDWRQGGTSWAVDYPKGDRTFAQILRRLTRINVRSVEQPVNLDDGDDIDHWPFMMVGLAGLLGAHRSRRSPRCANICFAAASCSATAFSARTRGPGSPPACVASFLTGRSSTCRTIIRCSTSSTTCRTCRSSRSRT